jgi:hypothetical protein
MAEAEVKQNDDAAVQAEGETGPGVAGIATERLIERFGGIRPMAAKLKIPVTTVQGWKKRGAIPASRHSDILAAAEAHAIPIEIIDVAATEPMMGEGVAGDRLEPQTPGKQRLWTDPLLWVGVSIAAFVFIAAMLVFTGLYIVKQKNADLAHRVNMLEAQVASATTLEGRMAALEKASRAAPAVEGQAADAQKRLADLASESAEIAALSQKMQDMQIANGNGTLLAQTVSGLQQTVASLQTSLQNLSQSMEAIKAKVAGMDAAFNERRIENARQFAILLAIDQLKAVASTSQPFATELNAARTLAHDDPEMMKPLDALAPYAEDGAATLNELRAEFADKATDIVRSNVVGDGQSYFRQALYQLGSVLSVRRVGSNVASKNIPETAVARAESKLEEDDLAGAVSSLGILTGLPKEVAAGWIDAATRRLAVDAALTSLSEAALQRLGALQIVPVEKP